jgi:glycosyltransferase involved in cell wall biosynthesis
LRVLFCSPFRLDPRLGSSGTLISLSTALERLGCECVLTGPEIAEGRGDYDDRLTAYLAERAGEFDVVDCDFRYVPKARSTLPEDVLIVARVQLLFHHYALGPVQRPPLDRNMLWWLRYVRDRKAKKRLLPRHEASLRAADAVVVLNRRDKPAVESLGVGASRIHVIPNGLGLDRRAALSALPADVPPSPRVAFIGNFGPRKGSLDLPRIFNSISQAVPGATFVLLGLGSDYSAEQYLGFFPRRLRERIDAVPAYAPDELPGALAPSSVGVFPSYAEGFGLGVIEMLAASIPVFAYDVPGPADILPDRFLVPRGDARELGRRTASLLLDRPRLERERAAASGLAERYDWDRVAIETLEVYRKARQQLGSGAHASALSQ